MTYLVTGVKGQLGYDVVKELKERGVSYNDILALDYEDMDITNKEQVDNIILTYKPDVIIHCAAYTAVDKAEVDKVKCYDINVNGPKNIADAAEKINAKMIYISTDYVFDGSKPFDETYKVDDKVNPQSVYGKTKFEGEEMVRKLDKHFIVRTSWVFGINGNNFVKTMLNLSDNHDELNVVSDQFGSPTYTVDLAKFLVDLAQSDKYGTYHANNEGYCSWADFASYILKDTNTKVNYVTTEEYYKGNTNVVAPRPFNSKLDRSKIKENGFEAFPDWKDAVDRYKEELLKKQNEVKAKELKMN